MLQDLNGYKIQVFTPTSGATLVSPYTPTEDEVVALASDCTITLDSKDVTYAEGTFVGLTKGVIYTLSASTDVHKM